ncbi:hypothetical protein K488DRAFT_67790 [Vararia minispora EC-137]|uniref:Uncharacterized protein n=1 Tax=Vararia minispora EC-137 TaxID=1314806 RepID=A0ACB8QXA2_9AGAM|nr:hypothetical protein K488DRAFT_67790 [Vararia minispora EC-137]
MPVVPRLSIASTLPAEILACIFQHMQAPLCDVQTPSSSALALRAVTHVCRHWRFAALAFSSLWVDVSTRLDSQRWIAETIRRSGAVPLHVDICWDPRAAADPVPAYVNLLLSEAARAERLSCFGPNLASRLRYIPQQPLKNLTTLALGTLCDDPLVPSDFEALLERSVPRLRELVTMGCQLPWASPLWANVSHTLLSLSIANIAQPLRPSPSELQNFLAKLCSLEHLALDHVLPIYPPHPPDFASSPTLLPRLRSLVVAEDCYENVAAFVASLARPAPTCTLALRFAPHLPSRSTLVMAIPALATAARRFLFADSSQPDRDPTVYDMDLRELPGGTCLAFRLLRITPDAPPLPLLSIDLAAADPASLLLAAPTWSWADAGAAAAALPFALAQCLRLRTFAVECTAFARARAWAAAFRCACVPPSRVRARGPAARGLVAALAGADDEREHEPHDTAHALLELMHQDCTRRAGPLFGSLTHAALCAVDLASALPDSRLLAEALCTALERRAAPLTRLALVGCATSADQVAHLAARLESTGCVLEWDGECCGVGGRVMPRDEERAQI